MSRAKFVRIALLGLGLLLAATAHAQTTLSVSPATVAPGGNVTATWSGIPAPSATDWLGLYTPAAQHTSYISWRYTTGTASGNVPFTIPAGTAPGTYQLRLFSNNGYTLLATSSNFTVVWSLSGTVTVSGSPLSGVAFTASSGGSCGTSNGSGQYTCLVPAGWSGSVTPSLSGYTFAPVSRSYSNVTSNQTAQNYTAVVNLQVSGTVTLNSSPLPGVVVTATNGVTCSATNASGQYSCTAPTGWSGSVTPSLQGYSFTPASRSYTSISSSQTAQNFTAASDPSSAAISYVHADHLNTPRLVANQVGQTVWRWDQWEPFGDSLPNENPSGLGAFEFSLRFPGQYADKETNLHYNMARDYWPEGGRYIQSDPIGLDGGINTYSYVGGNPLSYSDPTGTIFPVFAATALVGAGFSALASIGVQWYQTGSLMCVDRAQVWTATLVGAAAGALLPVATTSAIASGLPAVVGAAALGGVANVTQYWANFFLAGTPVSGIGALGSYGLGVVGGALGGALRNPNLLVGQPGVSTASLGTLPAVGTQSVSGLNSSQWNSVLGANAGLGNTARNLGGGIVSNYDPTATNCGCTR